MWPAYGQHTACGPAPHAALGPPDRLEHQHKGRPLLHGSCEHRTRPVAWTGPPTPTCGNERVRAARRRAAATHAAPITAPQHLHAGDARLLVGRVAVEGAQAGAARAVVLVPGDEVPAQPARGACHTSHTLLCKGTGALALCCQGAAQGRRPCSLHARTSLTQG